MQRILIVLIMLQTGMSTVCAERYYLGAGMEQISINSKHPSNGRQHATGYQVIVGVRWEHLGLDLTAGGASLETGEVTDIYYPPDSTEYGSIDLGLKYYFQMKHHERLVPWIGAGLGYHVISWDTYWYNVEGVGYSLCAGLDYRLISTLYLRGGLKYHWFTSDDTYGYGPYDGSTMEADIGVIWLFNESRWF